MVHRLPEQCGQYLLHQGVKYLAVAEKAGNGSSSDSLLIIAADLSRVNIVARHKCGTNFIFWHTSLGLIPKECNKMEPGLHYSHKCSNIMVSVDKAP